MSAFALSDSQLAIDCGKQYKITATPEDGYKFVRWTDGETDNPRIVTAMQDRTFEAVFEKIETETDTTHITGEMDLDDVTNPNIIVEPGGNLNINASGISIGVLIITADGVHSGQVHHGELPVTAEHIYLEYILNPWGTTANPNRWYAFAVPFEVDINGGISRTCDNKPLVSGTDFLIMKYDGWMRALEGKGWKKMESNETLVPGQFYMLGIDGTCNRWRFEKKVGRPYEGDAHDIQLSAFGSPNTANAGWNSLGNTLLEYAGLSNMSLSGINYMVTYDNQFGKYATKLISEIKDLFVGQPFFIQTTGDGSFDFVHNINNSANMPALRAPEQTITPMMHFTLADDTQSTGIDHMYLTMHEDADGTYTIGRDVARMTKDCKTAAQLWCTMPNGTELSAHGISMPETETVVPVTLFAPTKGEYLLNMSSRAMNDYQVELLFQDTYLATLFEGQPVTLNLNAGTNSGYAFRITRRNMPTGVEEVPGNKVQSTKVLIDNHLYILRGEHVYDAQGKQVK